MLRRCKLTGSFCSMKPCCEVPDGQCLDVCVGLGCLPAGVTSLDFSQRNPHILGVGMHDGTIAVYDVRSRQATPMLASTADTGKHADPVWKVMGLAQRLACRGGSA
jgi:WD40 repeat protein